MKFFPGGHPAFIQYGRQRWKATTVTLLSHIFWLQGHIPNQKSLWELFTQDGTDHECVLAWTMSAYLHRLYSGDDNVFCHNVFWTGNYFRHVKSDIEIIRYWCCSPRYSCVRKGNILSVFQSMKWEFLLSWYSVKCRSFLLDGYWRLQYLH